MKKKNFSRLKEQAIRSFFFSCGMLAILALAGIFIILLTTAFPAFKDISLKEFLGSGRWDPTSPEKAEYGILSMIVSTLLVTAGALLFAVPIGLGAACYLSDVAHWRVGEVVKPTLE